MIMGEFLYGLEWMLLIQVVQSFWTWLFDVVMLRHQIPTSITLCAIHQHHISPPTDVVHTKTVRGYNYRYSLWCVLKCFPYQLHYNGVTNDYRHHTKSAAITTWRHSESLTWTNQQTLRSVMCNIQVITQLSLAISDQWFIKIQRTQ